MDGYPKTPLTCSTRTFAIEEWKEHKYTQGAHYSSVLTLQCILYSNLHTFSLYTPSLLWRCVRRPWTILKDVGAMHVLDLSFV